LNWHGHSQGNQLSTDQNHQRNNYDCHLVYLLVKHSASANPSQHAQKGENSKQHLPPRGDEGPFSKRIAFEGIGQKSISFPPEGKRHAVFPADLSDEGNADK